MASARLNTASTDAFEVCPWLDAGQIKLLVHTEWFHKPAYDAARNRMNSKYSHIQHSEWDLGT